MKIGIDLVELKRIDSHRLIDRVLSGQEKENYNNITNDKAKLAYFGGRFAAKEALFKAISHGDLKANYRDITVLNDEFGKPYIKTKLVDSQNAILLSISHTDNYAVAMVIIVEPKL